MPVGWPRCPRGLRGIRLRPIERHGRGVLMHPGGRDGRHCQRCEDDGALHLVKIGRTQCLEDVSQPIIIECGPCEARLQQRHHATFFQPFPHLIESMIAIQHREDHSCAPAPTREHRRRVGWDEAVNDGSDLQAPSYTQDQRSMCYGMHLLHGPGHHVPPVVAFSRQHHSGVQAHLITSPSSRAKIVWFNLTP